MNENQVVYGAAKISNLGKKESYSILSTLYLNGIREIDTAPSYNTSEFCIGEFINDFSGFQVNTKIGANAAGEFNSNDIRKSVYRSLERLQITKINKLFIHSVPHQKISFESLQTLRDLKREGVFDYLGYSGDGVDLDFFTTSKLVDFDAFMFTYNFLDQSNQTIIKKNDVQQKLYVKRVLANAVWREQSLRDYCKILLGRSIGHDEYRTRMKMIYPQGIDNGYMRSIDLVRYQFPKAKYLFGITSSKQCKQIISYLEAAKEVRFLEIEDLIKLFEEASQRIDLRSVT